MQTKAQANPADLISLLKAGGRRVFIQAHNFPDHDAVAAGFALQYWLQHFGINAPLIYDGEIERTSLRLMIAELGIPIQQCRERDLHEQDYIVLIDGCKGNKNVTDLIGEEVAVIDHHETHSPEDVRYVDIRPDFGSSCTVIHTYYQSQGLEIPQQIATAMLIGLNLDTALMTRGVSPADIDAYADLYRRANISLVNSILRNQVQTRDLAFYRHAIDSIQITNRFAFCYFPQGCNQNLLGILGDFLLALEEVDFVCLCAQNEKRVNFSLRSERDDWNAARIIQSVLAGVGFGGGHKEMAGGLIPNAALFDPRKIEQAFLRELNII
ncbi:MAG: DHH family phosphoesterase [Leptospiraceae bacterium]|nr:DHH family phosphoesterase [Leptospiraceae bacterium]